MIRLKLESGFPAIFLSIKMRVCQIHGIQICQTRSELGLLLYTVGAKHTFNAGEYDPQKKPHFSFEMSPKGYADDMVEVRKYSIRTAGVDLQMWGVKNRMNLPLLVTIKRDGVLIRVSNCVIKY